MKRKGRPFLLYAFFALLGISGICLAIVSGADAITGTAGIFTDPSILWKRLVWPLLRLACFVSIGLFIGQVIEAAGWTHKMTVLVRPLMRWGHIPDRMSAVFTTAFFSNITSLSMLGSFYKDGLVKRRETTLSVLLNSFPSFFPHLPTTFFILIPLAGSAGAIYLSLLFVAALLRLITILTYTRLTLPVVEPPSVLDSKETPRARNWNRLLPETFGKVKSRLVRILAIVLPVYLIILAASEAGFFLWLRGFLARGIVGIAVPVEAMSVVIISLVAEATSGYAAAGAMMDAGTLSIFQTVLALLVGNIVATPVRVLRHQMPYYMGVFGPVSGFRLILASQAFRMASIICVGTVFILCAKIRI